MADRNRSNIKKGNTTLARSQWGARKFGDRIEDVAAGLSAAAKASASRGHSWAPVCLFGALKLLAPCLSKQGRAEVNKSKTYLKKKLDQFERYASLRGLS